MSWDTSLFNPSTKSAPKGCGKPFTRLCEGKVSNLICGNYPMDICPKCREDTKSVFDIKESLMETEPNIKEALMKEAMEEAEGDQEVAVNLLFSKDWKPTDKYAQNTKIG